ncbi:hypothetical protein KIPB_009208, partial [Kipferlia bialata]|eukprot:g9208.t1
MTPAGDLLAGLGENPNPKSLRDYSATIAAEGKAGSTSAVVTLLTLSPDLAPIVELAGKHGIAQVAAILLLNACVLYSPQSVDSQMNMMKGLNLQAFTQKRQDFRNKPIRTLFRAITSLLTSVVRRYPALALSVLMAFPLQ